MTGALFIRKLIGEGVFVNANTVDKYTQCDETQPVFYTVGLRYYSMDWLSHIWLFFTQLKEQYDIIELQCSIQYDNLSFSGIISL